MSRSRRSLIVAAAVLATLTSGCGGGGGGGGGGTAGPGFHGVLRDEAGAPLGRAEVLACQATVCQFGVTDASGKFAFRIEPPAEVAIKTREDPAALPPRGSALYPVRVVDSSSVDVDDVHIPTLPAGTPLASADQDPQTLAAGDGLVLTLRRADLDPGGHVLTEVAARGIRLDRMPSLPDLAGEDVVAVFALHPFSIKSRSPIAVKAPSKLPAGTAVKIQTISDLDGNLSAAVAGRSDGEFVTTDPGTGISELTWLVISR